MTSVSLPSKLDGVFKSLERRTPNVSVFDVCQWSQLNVAGHHSLLGTRLWHHRFCTYPSRSNSNCHD